MTNSQVKAKIRALQAEIGSDPAYARPSYSWCREQLKQENFARNDWAGFVAACKAVAKRAGHETVAEAAAGSRGQLAQGRSPRSNP